MTIPKKQENGVRTAIRLPAEIYADVQKVANFKCISMNAEIIERVCAGPTWAALDEIRRLTAKMEAMQQKIEMLLDK